MAQKLKFGNGTFATKKGSTLAYNDEGGNYKPLPFTTTRNSIATRVNKEGLIEVVGNDVPRIDYTDSADGVLLLENSATNLITYSEDFSDSSWSKLSNVAITPNTTISPIGFLDADTCTFTTSGTNTQLYKVVSTSGSTQTLSIFIKYLSGSGTNIRFSISSAEHNGVDLTFSNNGETLSAVKGTNVNDFSIEKLKNNWFRVSISVSHSASSTEFNLYKVSGSETDSYAIWGAQIETNQSFKSSYIPTQGSSIQRAADTANGAGNSEVFNSEQGILFANIAALSNDLTNRTISLNDGTTSNTVRIEYLTVSNAIWAIVTNIGAGGNQGILQYTSPDITINSKVAVKYKENDFSLWVNGFEVATDTSGVTFSANTLNTLDFDRSNYDRDFYGKTKEIGYYDEILTDLELEYLTSYRSLNELVTELNLNEL